MLHALKARVQRTQCVSSLATRKGRSMFPTLHPARVGEHTTASINDHSCMHVCVGWPASGSLHESKQSIWCLARTTICALFSGKNAIQHRQDSNRVDNGQGVADAYSDISPCRACEQLLPTGSKEILFKKAPNWNTVRKERPTGRRQPRHSKPCSRKT